MELQYYGLAARRRNSMLYRTVILIAAAAICAVVSGIAQAAPIKPLPVGVVGDAGTTTQVYYYRYHYRYHPHAYYHRYGY
jgi:hypothetical protein